jgi:hypothetical protein
MKVVNKYLEQKQVEFAQHPFFERLDRQAPLGDVLQFAKAMTFWIMSFQDILRLNEIHITDPMLKKVAHGHKAEDAGHEVWFLNDLLTVEGDLPDVCFLFSRAHAGIRDVSYALVSEVFRAKSDVERIALVLALESTGHIFFEKISTYLENAKYGEYDLFRYFSRKHLDVELDHEVFEDEKHEYLENLQLTAEQEKACYELVDRAYVNFNTMFDHVEQAIRRNESQEQDAERQRQLAA